jgi:hypothetical protein
MRYPKYHWLVPAIARQPSPSPSAALLAAAPGARLRHAAVKAKSSAAPRLRTDSAEPQIIPVSQLHAGMKGYGLTTFRYEDRAVGQSAERAPSLLHGAADDPCG